MLAIRAKFDGQKIELPAELRGAAPGDVLIVYPAGESVAPPSPVSPSSIWDVFGKAAKKRSADDINAQVRSDRESWDKQ
jgi:hypothetical protein